MGTFGGYYGSNRISKDKIDEFTDAISKILYYGGMMTAHEVDMYGMELVLLDPVTVEPGRDVDFHYNYFEDDTWEDAGYVYGEQRFFSNKIGSNEFNRVITAVYCLHELYDEGVGLAHVNGEIVPCDYYIGWINHILNKDYSMSRRFNLWKNIEYYVLNPFEYSPDPAKFGDLLDLIPKDYLQYAGGTELSDILYIIKGTEELKEDEVVENTYPADVLMCKRAVANIIKEYDKDEAYSKILSLLNKQYDSRRKENHRLLTPLAECSLFISARTILYLACEKMGKAFWEEWKQAKDTVYTDEIPKKYASDELESYRREGRERPIEKIKTSLFLKNDNPFVFWDTPEELKERPNYYISDADRLYWWDGTDEVEITGRTEEWLLQRVEEYKIIYENTSDVCDTQVFVKDFIELLYRIEERYKRVFAFQSMFYEFVSNGNKKEYRAAVEVLRKLYEDNAEDGKIIEKMTRYWSYANKNITCNRGRMNMKRYLSLLANVKLREKYLGF